MTDPQDEWVSLGEAAEILGVHPTTLRHWADQGGLPSQRTPGGHRRFRRRDLLQWASSTAHEASPTEATLMMQTALGRARFEVGAGQLQGQGWYDRFDEQTRQAHRALGRRLLEMLTAYLADPHARPGMLEEIHTLGAEYARLSLGSDLSLADSVRAFLFFRDLIIDSVIQMAEVLSLHTPHDWGDRIRQVNLMTDALLLAVIEEYERGATPAS
jgi:excisionase family DNA binding protein